jgi:hypothetical protein
MRRGRGIGGHIVPSSSCYLGLVILRPRKGFGHRSIRIGDEVRPAPRKGRRHGSRCCTAGVGTSEKLWMITVWL